MFNFKRDKVREEILPEGIVYLGEKTVEIPKLTPELFKKLTRVTENLPALALKLMSAQDEETVQAYIVAALDFVADEIVAVTSALTEIESEYLEKNVGMNEMIRYLKLTADKNDITPLVKNLMSLLSKAQNQEQPADK